MKKLKMDLDGIGELLSKEQMKMVTGGEDYANYVTCYYFHTIYGTNTTDFEHFNYYPVNEPYCDSFCQANEPTGTPGVDYWAYASCSKA